MKTTTSALRTAAAVGALALSSIASAIPISSMTVSWNDAVGGAGIVYNQANGVFTDVRWGVGPPPSGLGFDPATPVDPAANTDFLLGTLRHYNNPIQAGTAVSSVDLDLGATITGATPMVQLFAFRFLVDETSNVAGTCVYPSTVPCADRITFQNLDLTSAFAFGGNSYTLALAGFRASVESPLLAFFDSQEGGTNTVGLYGRFIAAPTVRVPEPGTLGLISLGLFLTGFAVRRKTR